MIKKRPVKANRIPLPIEQDQVNIHTAFTVGTGPTVKCDTEDPGELNLLSALKFTLKKNFIKYANKQEVRSWLSEQEVAEYCTQQMTRMAFGINFGERSNQWLDE